MSSSSSNLGVPRLGGHLSNGDEVLVGGGSLYSIIEKKLLSFKLPCSPSYLLQTVDRWVSLLMVILDWIAGQVGGGHWPDRDREQQILAGGNVKKGWERSSSSGSSKLPSSTQTLKNKKDCI